MTRKDYQLLSDTIKNVHNDAKNRWQRTKLATDASATFATRALATDIGIALSKHNNAFDLTRWLRDCGIVDGV